MQDNFAIPQVNKITHSSQTTNEATEKLFKVNIISHFALIRELLPGMLSMRKGHIVTVASMLSFFPADNLVDYACTKIGALYLSEGGPLSTTSSSAPLNLQAFAPNVCAPIQAVRAFAPHLYILDGTPRVLYGAQRAHWPSAVLFHAHQRKFLLPS